MNHVILTRIRFKPEERKLRDKYLLVTRMLLVPALLTQTCQAFKWVIMCNPWDATYLESVLDYPFFPVIDQKSFNLTARLHNWTIQTRHDCDDYADPRYVERIQDAAGELLDRYPDLDRFLLQSQPVKWDIRTGQESKIQAYTATRTSMHLTLVQRQVTTNIHARPHGEMYKEAQKVTNLGSLTKWVIHGANISLNR